MAQTRESTIPFPTSADVFRYKRALVAFVAVCALLGLLGFERRVETAYFDDSPFAESWTLCDRVAWGWPAAFYREAVLPDSMGCRGLPDFDPFAIVIDGGFIGAIGLVAAFVAGRYPKPKPAAFE